MQENKFFLLLKSTGLTMSPHVDVVHGFEIHFNASDRSSWKKYAKALEAQLKSEFCLKGAFDGVKQFVLFSLKYVCIYLPAYMQIYYCGNFAQL